MPFKTSDYDLQRGFTSGAPHRDGTNIDSMSIVKDGSETLLNIRYVDGSGPDEVYTMQVLDMYSAKAFRTLVMAGALDVKTIASQTLSTGWTAAEWEQFLDGKDVDANWPIKPEHDLTALIALINLEVGSSDSAKFGSGTGSDSKVATTATADVNNIHTQKGSAGWSNVTSELEQLQHVLVDNDDLQDGVDYVAVRTALDHKKASVYEDTRAKIRAIENDYQSAANDLKTAVGAKAPFVRIGNAVLEAMWTVQSSALTLPSGLVAKLIEPPPTSPAAATSLLKAQAQVLSLITSDHLDSLAVAASGYLGGTVDADSFTDRKLGDDATWTESNIEDLLTIDFPSLVRKYGASAADELEKRVNVLVRLDLDDSDVSTHLKGMLQDLKPKFALIKNWLSNNVKDTTMRIADIQKLSGSTALATSQTTPVELMTNITVADNNFRTGFYSKPSTYDVSAYGSIDEQRKDLVAQVRGILEKTSATQKRFRQYHQVKSVLADLMNVAVSGVDTASALNNPASLLSGALETARKTINDWSFRWADVPDAAGLAANYDISINANGVLVETPGSQPLTLKKIRKLLSDVGKSSYTGTAKLVKRADSTQSNNGTELYLLAQIYLFAAHDYICLRNLSEFYSGTESFSLANSTGYSANVKVVAGVFHQFEGLSKWAVGDSDTFNRGLLDPTAIGNAVATFNTKEEAKRAHLDGGSTVQTRIASLLGRSDMAAIGSVSSLRPDGKRLDQNKLSILYTEKVLEVRKSLYAIPGSGIAAPFLKLGSSSNTMVVDVGSLNSLTLSQLKAFVHSDRMGSNTLGLAGTASLGEMALPVLANSSVGAVTQAVFKQGLYFDGLGLEFSSMYDKFSFAPDAGASGRPFSPIEEAQLSSRFALTLSSMLTDMSADLDNIVTFSKTKATLAQCIRDLLHGNHTTTVVSGWGGSAVWTDLHNHEVIELEGITDLSYLFSTSSSLDISSVWETSSGSHEAVRRGIRNAVFKMNVSGVKNMSYMFAGSKIDIAKSSDAAHEGYRITEPSSGKYTHDFAHWADKLGNLETCEGMFKDCSTLVGRGIASWISMPKLTNLTQMFMNCSVFNQSVEQFRWKRGSYQETDISGEVTLKEMFRACYAFDQPVGGWIMTNVFSLEGTFRDCRVFDQPLIRWTRGLATTALSGGHVPGSETHQVGGSAYLKHYSIQHSYFYYSQPAPTDRKTLALAHHTEDITIHAGYNGLSAGDSANVAIPKHYSLTGTYRKSGQETIRFSSFRGGLRRTVLSSTNPETEYPLIDHFSDLRRITTMAYMCYGCLKFSGEFTKAITREFIASYYYCSEYHTWLPIPDRRYFPTPETAPDLPAPGVYSGPYDQTYNRLPVYLSQNVRGMFFEHDTHYLESLETMECAFMGCSELGKYPKIDYWGFSRLSLPKCRNFRSMFKNCTLVNVSQVGHWLHYHSSFVNSTLRQKYRDYGPKALNKYGGHWTYPGALNPLDPNAQLHYATEEKGQPANYFYPLYGRGTRSGTRRTIPADRWASGGNLTGKGNNSVSREWMMLDGWEIVQSQTGTVDYTSMFECCRELQDIFTMNGNLVGEDYIDRFFDQITAASSPAPILRLMFAGCWFFNGNVTGWKIRNPQVRWGEMLFFNCHLFDRDVSQWQSETNAASRTLYRGYAAPPGTSVASTHTPITTLPFVKRLIYDVTTGIGSWRFQVPNATIDSWKITLGSLGGQGQDLVDLFNNTFVKSTHQKYFRQSDIEFAFHGCYKLLGGGSSIKIPEWIIVISDTVQGITGGKISGTKGCMRRGGVNNVLSGWPEAGHNAQLPFLKTATSADLFVDNKNPVWTDPEAFWGLLESRILVQLATLFCGHSWENSWDFMNPGDIISDFKNPNGTVNSAAIINYTGLRNTGNGIGQLFRTGTQVSNNGLITYHSSFINSQQATPRLPSVDSTFQSFKALSGFNCFLDPNNSAQRMTCVFEESFVEAVFSTQTATGHTSYPNFGGMGGIGGGSSGSTGGGIMQSTGY